MIPQKHETINIGGILIAKVIEPNGTWCLASLGDRDLPTQTKNLFTHIGVNKHDLQKMFNSPTTAIFGLFETKAQLYRYIEVISHLLRFPKELHPLLAAFYAPKPLKKHETISKETLFKLVSINVRN